MKRIIIEMNVDYWTDEMRKEVMKYLIHNLKVYDAENNDHSDFEGCIIEPKKPYPIIPLALEDDVYDIVW